MGPWIEGDVLGVDPRIAQAGQGIDGLGSNCGYAIDERVPGRRGMSQGQFQVVQDGQPRQRDRCALLCPQLCAVPGGALSHIICVSQRTAPHRIHGIDEASIVNAALNLVR